MQYNVQGYALMPVQCKITVSANSPEEAIKAAQQIFKRDKGSVIVEKSEDYQAAFDWEPTAMPV